MSETSLDISLEKELDLLHEEIGKFKNGVSYIEQASALIRLAEKSAAGLEVELAGKLENIEKIMTSLQQSGTIAEKTAQTLQRLVTDLRADSMVSRLDDVKASLLEASKTINSRIDRLSSSLDTRLIEILELLQRVLDKASSDSKNVQTQLELYTTKLSLIEERTAARQKSQSMLLILSNVIGFITLAVAIFILV